MADLVLNARAPLAHCAVPMRLGSREEAPGVVLGVVSDPVLTLVVAHTGRAAALRAAAAAAGVEVPTTPHATLSDGFSVIWAGPAQWLLVAEPLGRQAAAQLQNSISAHAMIIDQSDARAVVTVTGPRARACLAKGFPIDLHSRSFGPGDAALTVAAGISAQIWQTNETPTYRISVPRSYGESFWHWLTEAAAEYGCG